MKKTKRKAFNFLRSYFDVLNELKTDKDKLDFLMAIINKQFLNEDPDKLSFLANLCYQSQRHQIESSVKGWERASKDTLGTTPSTPPPTDPQTTLQEEEEKGEEEVKVKVKEKKEKPYREFKHLSITNDEVEKLKEHWNINQINNIFDSVENYSKNKNYTSLYLTARSWLSREFPIRNHKQKVLTEAEEWELEQQRIAKIKSEQ